MAGPDEIRAGGAVVEFRADSSKLERDLKENGGMLNAIKNAFGGRSTMKDINEILLGGGAVVGLSLAGRTLAQLSSGALEMRDALADGSKSTGEILEKLAASVPVLGNFWTFGRNLREAYTGEGAAEAATLKTSQAALILTEKRAAAMRLVVAATNDVEKAVEKMNRIAFLADKNPYEQEIWRGRFEAIEAAAKIKKEYDVALASADARDKDRIIAEMRKRLTAFNSAFQRQEAATIAAQETEKAKGVTDALDSFFGPIEDKYERARASLGRDARSMIADADPFAAFKQSMEQAALAAHEGYLNQDELNRVLQHAQATLSDATTKYSARGTFESSAVGSLNQSFEFPKMINDTARVRQIMEQIYIKIQNKELSMVFN